MQSLPQMFAGELDFQFFDSTQGTVLMAGGKLRGLAITSGKRVAGSPHAAKLALAARACLRRVAPE